MYNTNASRSLQSLHQSDNVCYACASGRCRFVRWSVPETLAHPKLFRWQAVMPHKVLAILVSTPAIRNVAIVFWCVNMCFGPYQLGALYSEMRFGWDALDIGLFLGCVAMRCRLTSRDGASGRSHARRAPTAAVLTTSDNTAMACTAACASRYAGFTAMVAQGVVTPLLLPRLGYLDSMCVGVAFGIFHFALLGLSSSQWMYVAARQAEGGGQWHTRGPAAPSPHAHACGTGGTWSCQSHPSSS